MPKAELAPPPPTIHSIGPPPERHADRVVAEMLRQLAVQKAARFPAIISALKSSRDGGPRAQRRMQERVERAGALASLLTPGKRGCYELFFYDLTGWDVSRDAEITTSDRIPDKPWLAYHMNLLTSLGRGREQRKLKSSPILFITHHVLSRTAQRFGATHSQHLLNATLCIFNGMLEQVEQVEQAGGLRQWLDAIPPEGLRLPVVNAIVVLKRHETRKALVAATIFRNDDDDSWSDRR
jgi:hypothetical protein